MGEAHGLLRGVFRHRLLAQVFARRRNPQITGALVAFVYGPALHCAPKALGSHDGDIHSRLVFWYIDAWIRHYVNKYARK